MNDEFLDHHILFVDPSGNDISVMIVCDNTAYLSLGGIWEKTNSKLFETKEEVDALINLLQRVRDNLPSQKEL